MSKTQDRICLKGTRFASLELNELLIYNVTNITNSTYVKLKKPKQNKPETH